MPCFFACRPGVLACKRAIAGLGAAGNVEGVERTCKILHVFLCWICESGADEATRCALIQEARITVRVGVAA